MWEARQGGERPPRREAAAAVRDFVLLYTRKAATFMGYALQIRFDVGKNIDYAISSARGQANVCPTLWVSGDPDLTFSERAELAEYACSSNSLAPLIWAGSLV